jgi:hypothetical protein
MKKRLRLKDSVKTALMVIGFVVLMICLFCVWQERIERINSGEMIVVSQSEMDR